ncbi:MAG TPA: c-type cytochrome domain-containing protein [Steroidobacteraceae bacterium]|nr:c-type cytochrome domain-containing protein [Steroidobacteraceae bacterium]
MTGANIRKLTVAALVLSAWWHAAGAQQQAPSLPVHLRDTGLYAPGQGTQIDPRNLPFSPQYPLWSDGAVKRRWIYLPPGTAIDAANADAWDFPRGTRLWKEFSLDRPVETRFIERLADGTWRFGTYIWNEEGTDATLAPAGGIASLPARGAPREGYAVPSEFDCRACHEGAAAPVLGFSALQLSADRDPLAPHTDARSGIDLKELVARGLVKNLPPALIDAQPRIAANSPVERAALGYLHGNCGHCHNRNGAPVPVDLTLAQSAVDGADGVERVLRSMIADGRFRAHGASSTQLVAPGQPEASLLVTRVRSRNPQTQMPPIGTRLIDTEALVLIERWIKEKSSTEEELKP